MEGSIVDSSKRAVLIATSRILFRPSIVKRAHPAESPTHVSEILRFQHPVACGS